MIGEVDVHSFREEKNYVIDVAFQQAEKTPLPEQQAAAAPVVPAKPLPAARVSRDRRLKEAMPPPQPAELPPVTSEMIAEQARIEIKPGQATEAPERMPAATEIATPAADKVTPVTENVAPAAGKMAVAPANTSPVEAAKTAQPAEPMQAAAAEAPKPIAPGQAPAPVEAAKPATPAVSAPLESGANNKSASVEARRDSDALRVTFSFAAPTPAALFRRADTVWLMFDQTTPIDVEPIRAKGGSIVGDVSRLPLEGAAVPFINRPQIPSSKARAAPTAGGR